MRYAPTISGFIAVFSQASLSDAKAFISRRQIPGQPLPKAIDGAYITMPPPGPTETSVDWWYFSFIGEPVDGVVPTFELNFNRGFAFTIPQGGPRWRLDAQVVFPNGTTWELSQGIDIPTDGSDPTTVTEPGGQGVFGQWGTIGSFKVSEDRQTIDIELTNPVGGLTGSVHMLSTGLPAHTSCESSEEALSNPYYTRLGNDAELSESERSYYRQAGWVMPMPRADTTIKLNVGGSEFALDNAYGYHDKSWAPRFFSTFTNTWSFGTGYCGPLDFSFYEVQATNSTRKRDIMYGFLAKDDQSLQTQCSVYGELSEGQPDSVEIKYTGTRTDSLGLQVPTGIVLNYVLKNGDHYQFTLDNKVYFPERTVYHRFRATGSGGLVGGEQFDCVLTHEWLNPGRVLYTEGKSIFEA